MQGEEGDKAHPVDATCMDVDPILRVLTSPELIGCVYEHVVGCGACEWTWLETRREAHQLYKPWSVMMSSAHISSLILPDGCQRSHWAPAQKLCGRCAGRLVCNLWSREVKSNSRRRDRAIEMIIGASPSGRPTKLRSFGHLVRNDARCVLSAISTHGGACLKHASEARRDEELLVRAAIRSSPLALRHASARLRDDRALVREAVCQDPRASSFASERLRREDEEIIWGALWRCYYDRGCTTSYDGDEMGERSVEGVHADATGNDDAISDYAASEAPAIDQQPAPLMSSACTRARERAWHRRPRGLSMRIRSVREHDFRTWHGAPWLGMTFPGAAASFWADLNFLRAACLIDGRVLSDVRAQPQRRGAPSCRDDERCVAAALRSTGGRQSQPQSNTGDALRHASARLRDKRDFVIRYLRAHDTQPVPALSIRFFSERLRDDQEVVLLAVRACGRALEFASSRLQATHEVALAAVTECGGALEHCAPPFQDDAAFVTTAEGLAFASARLRDDDELVERLMRRAGWESTLVHASERIRASFAARVRATEMQGLRLQHGRVVDADAIDLS